MELFRKPNGVSDGEHYVPYVLVRTKAIPRVDMQVEGISFTEADSSTVLFWGYRNKASKVSTYISTLIKFRNLKSPQ